MQASTIISGFSVVALFGFFVEDEVRQKGSFTSQHEVWNNTDFFSPNKKWHLALGSNS